MLIIGKQDQLRRNPSPRWIARQTRSLTMLEQTKDDQIDLEEYIAWLNEQAERNLHDKMQEEGK